MPIPPLLRVYKFNVKGAIFKNLKKAGMGSGVRDEKYFVFVIAGMSRSEKIMAAMEEMKAFVAEITLDIAKDVGLQDKNLEMIP